MTKSDLQLDETATLIGRVERKTIGPSIVTVRDGVILDISKKSAPTVRDVLELDDPVTYVRSVKGEPLGQLAEIAEALLAFNSIKSLDSSIVYMSSKAAPIDVYGVESLL